MPPSVCRRGGFTLLELVITLALLGLISGLAWPRLNQTVERIQQRFELDRVLEDLNSLGYFAYNQAQTFVLHTDPRRHYAPLQLPNGWQVRAMQQPIVYHNNGVCDGGVLILQSAESVSSTYRLAAPLCQAQLQD